jgi:hypothetical protein
MTATRKTAFNTDEIEFTGTVGTNIDFNKLTVSVHMENVVEVNLKVT